MLLEIAKKYLIQIKKNIKTFQTKLQIIRNYKIFQKSKFLY